LVYRAADYTFTSLALRQRSTRLRNTYITPSTKPHAILQPIAPLALNMMPLEELLKTLFHILL